MMNDLNLLAFLMRNAKNLRHFETMSAKDKLPNVMCISNYECLEVQAFKMIDAQKPVALQMMKKATGILNQECPY